MIQPKFVRFKNTKVNNISRKKEKIFVKVILFPLHRKFLKVILFTFFFSIFLGPGFDSLKIHENEKSAYNLKQNYTIVKQILEHSLEGFCPRDEKFFKEHIKKNIDEFLKCLRDPSLPLIEFREAMASGIYTLDILFCQITMFLKVHVTFIFGLQTL